MPRILILATLALLAAAQAPAYADDIKTWTDENGVKHFGDNASAPKQSKKVDATPVNTVVTAKYHWGLPRTYSEIVEERQRNAQFARQMAPFTGPRGGAPRETVPMADQVPAKPRCAELARQVANTIGQVAGRANEQISSLCPGVKYECRTYRSNSRSNRCVAVAAVEPKEEGRVSNLVSD